MIGRLTCFRSYGLFKASDKKMLKTDGLAAELGRPEKLVEM